MSLFRFLFSPTLVAAGFAFSIPFSVHAAVTLQDADSYWKFDIATTTTDGTNVTTAQIIDSSVNSHVVSSAARLTWATVPATGPYGGESLGPIARGISFNPVTDVLNPGSAALDTIGSATFNITNGSIKGSAAIVTRFMWDGNIPGSDDGPSGNYYWIAKNGYGGGGAGFLFGLLGNADGNTARLTYLTFGGASGTSTSTSTFALTKGLWYDIAMVVDDNGNSSTTADNTVSFYAYSVANGLQSYTSTNMYVSGAETTNPTNDLFIGSEAPGSGSTNIKKAFDGTMDYLAVFDVAMTQSDVLGVFAAPEPSRALLIMLGFAGLFMRRRK